MYVTTSTYDAGNASIIAALKTLFQTSSVEDLLHRVGLIYSHFDNEPTARLQERFGLAC